MVPPQPRQKALESLQRQLHNRPDQHRFLPIDLHGLASHLKGPYSPTLNWLQRAERPGHAADDLDEDDYR